MSLLIVHYFYLCTWNLWGRVVECSKQSIVPDRQGGVMILVRLGWGYSAYAAIGVGSVDLVMGEEENWPFE